MNSGASGLSSEYSLILSIATMLCSRATNRRTMKRRSLDTAIKSEVSFAIDRNREAVEPLRETYQCWRKREQTQRWLLRWWERREPRRR